MEDTSILYKVKLNWYTIFTQKLNQLRVYILNVFQNAPAEKSEIWFLYTKVILKPST